MFAAVLAVLLATSPGPANAARAELEGVAQRIAHLKERRLAGEPVDEELTRLLVRAQELAAAIERTSPPRRSGAAPGLPPEELRERADAARDEADRVWAQIEEIDRTLEDVDRERRREAALEALAGDSALFGDSDVGGRRAARSSTAGTAATAATAAEAPRGTSSALVEDTRRRQPSERTRDDAALPAEGAAAEVRSLQAQRAALAERIAALQAEAERLDAAAKRAADE
ncbi:MAG TPA: hypothetical protein VD838_04930 [Anaeromyxobacteraceae bacterium]|nr:hypothetical protein [Anaeromyxobacteraceae bacterium]